MYDKNQIEDSLEFCRRVQDLHSSDDEKIEKDDENLTADELFEEMAAKIQGIGSTKPWEKVLDDLNNGKTTDYSSKVEFSKEDSVKKDIIENKAATEESKVKTEESKVKEETVVKESKKKESLLKSGFLKAGFRKENYDSGINYSLLGDDYEPPKEESKSESKNEYSLLDDETEKTKINNSKEYSLLEDTEPVNKRSETVDSFHEEKPKTDRWKSEVNYSLLGDDPDLDEEEPVEKKKQSGTNYSLLGDETELDNDLGLKKKRWRKLQPSWR